MMGQAPRRSRRSEQPSQSLTGCHLPTASIGHPATLLSTHRFHGPIVLTPSPPITFTNLTNLTDSTPL